MSSIMRPTAPLVPRGGALLLATLAVFAFVSCGRDRDRAEPAKYLYVWAADADGNDSDFLAVVDVDSTSMTYGQVIATTPIGATQTMPHHTELTLPERGRPLFASGFMSGQTFLFDVADPAAPKLTRVIDSVPGFRQPHSYWRLRDGRVLATLQFGDSATPGNAGGLALFSPTGDLIRTVSSADSAFAGADIRTYSLDVAEGLDRIVTTSSPMNATRPADVVQVWRLRDLALLKTIALPDEPADSADQYPFEVRFLPDGNAFLNTRNCGFYLLTGLAGGSPAIERILALPGSPAMCGVPTLKGHHWIMPVGTAGQYLVLDIADPRRPRIASLLAADSGFFPHWTSVDPGSDRIVMQSGRAMIPNPPDNRIRLARFDSTAGLLTWDMSFGRGGSGVSFNRESWPHGTTGPAVPHAAVFGPGAR